MLGVLQNWLDSPTRRVGLVVSGSSVRMMHSAVLDSGAPLYGRATEAFAVRPLRAGYLADVFPHLTPRELVCAYAVWGGMPRYWELAEPFSADIEAAVDTLVLDPTGAVACGTGSPAAGRDTARDGAAAAPRRHRQRRASSQRNRRAARATGI